MVVHQFCFCCVEEGDSQGYIGVFRGAAGRLRGQSGALQSHRDGSRVARPCYRGYISADESELDRLCGRSVFYRKICMKTELETPEESRKR